MVECLYSVDSGHGMSYVSEELRDHWQQLIQNRKKLLTGLLVKQTIAFAKGQIKQVPVLFFCISIFVSISFIYI